MVSERELNGGLEKEVSVSVNISAPPTMFPTTKRDLKLEGSPFLKIPFCFSSTLISHLLLCPLLTAIAALLLPFALAEESVAHFILYQNAQSPHRRKITV